ncbi:hypothetical protein TNCV_2306821 [Trichonephila clavipes]|nr:hypothetical protein TNCV_2306821 [Trichonephila clavipes]
MSLRLEIWTVAQKGMTMHENVKKEVTRAPEEEGPDFDRDHLSKAQVELRLRIQFRGSVIKEGPQITIFFY